MADRLGAALLKHRQQAGRTLRQVSEVTGYSIGYLSNLECDQRLPSRQMIEALASALGLEGERRASLIRLAQGAVCRAAVRRWERGVVSDD